MGAIEKYRKKIPKAIANAKSVRDINHVIREHKRQDVTQQLGTPPITFDH